MKSSNTSERLKEIMKLRRLRQIDILNQAKPFCEKYGVKLGKNDLSQYVNGKVEPGQEKLTILGLALNVSETWLMGYDVPMDRENDALFVYISEECESGRMAATDDMFRTFGTEYGTSKLRGFSNNKVALLYYRAMQQPLMSEFSGIISDVEDLSLREMANVRDILRAYLRADASRKEIVDFALKPYMGTPPSEESDICAEF